MNSSVPSLVAQRPRSVWIIAAIVAVGIALRVGVICLWPDKLRIDTDAYLAYANAWAETGTFGYEGRPTAFRPPGYPWLLSLFGPPTIGWIVAINVLSGAATILLVWLTARQFRMSPQAAALAAQLVAIDPLLVQYAGHPMTESLCTFESALLLWLIAKSGLVRVPIEPDPTPGQGRAMWSLAAGVVGGVSILCRPTFLIFVVALFVSTLLLRGIQMRRCPDASPSPPLGTDQVQSGGDRGGEGRGEGSSLLPSPPQVAAGSVDRRLRGRGSGTFLKSNLFPIALFVAGVAIPVGAWGVRNQLLLDFPVITTTHGGYTLLLGNNADYYREVVDQSIGTEWDGVEEWSDKLNRSLEDKGLSDEVERDRAMRDEAVDTIRNQPGGFVRACLLRCLNFWAITPSGEARAGLPTMVVVAAGAFYIVWWLLSVAGFVQAVRTKADSLLPAICLIAAFASVHMVYWSNARMRAPVLPALALLAAYSLSARRRLARRPAE